MRRTEEEQPRYTGEQNMRCDEGQRDLWTSIVGRFESRSIRADTLYLLCRFVVDTLFLSPHTRTSRALPLEVVQAGRCRSIEYHHKICAATSDSNFNVFDCEVHIKKRCFGLKIVAFLDRPGRHPVCANFTLPALRPYRAKVSDRDLLGKRRACFHEGKTQAQECRCSQS